MIGLGLVYVAAGLAFSGYAIASALKRRFANAAFWGLIALSFLAGDRLGDLGNGVLVLGLAAIAGLGLLRPAAPIGTSPEERQILAARFGERLFIPALLMPMLLIVGILIVKPLQIGGTPLLDPKQATLVSVVVAALAATATALVLLRQPPVAAVQEGRRLMDTLSWTALVPQMLAALGAIFALSGVGDQVGALIESYLPLDSRLAAVAAYAIGMALFTVLTGNAFAAFPVVTAAVGIPILIEKFGGDPAIVCAIGMLSGFCGTLMTPLAANFNLVPAALLELKDRYAVIKVQIPTALIVLFANIVLIHVLAFR
jgi:uncharacterized membrane protein